MAAPHLPRPADHPEYAEKQSCCSGAELLSIKPWNTGTGGCVACEDMPRKSIDIRLTDDPVPEEKGQLRPFPAIRRGRVRAEPEIGSRDWSLVGVGATPQGLKTINICNFQGSAKPIFSAQFFISHLTLPAKEHRCLYAVQIPALLTGTPAQAPVPIPGSSPGRSGGILPGLS